MVARRKAPRRRAKKSFNVSAIELGTALSGDLSGALTSLESSVMSNKNRIIGTLGAAFVAKALTKGFTSGTLAKLGPIRVKA